MGADLFVVTGVLEDLKEKIVKLDKVIMDSNEEDIDWKSVNNIADSIQELANILLDESESELD